MIVTKVLFASVLKIASKYGTHFFFFFRNTEPIRNLLINVRRVAPSAETWRRAVIKIEFVRFLTISSLLRQVPNKKGFWIKVEK